MVQISFDFYDPKTGNEILNQSLWFNSHIKINTRIIFNKSWHEAGIKYVVHLTKKVNNNFIFLTPEELYNKDRPVFVDKLTCSSHKGKHYLGWKSQLWSKNPITVKFRPLWL